MADDAHAQDVDRVQEKEKAGFQNVHVSMVQNSEDRDARNYVDEKVPATTRAPSVVESNMGGVCFENASPSYREVFLNSQ